MDEIHTFEGQTQTVVGSAVMFSAMGATWSDKTIAVITRMASRDVYRLRPLRDAGVDVHVSPTPETNRYQVYHLTDNPDERRLVCTHSAGTFTLADLAAFSPTHLHLAGVNGDEFPSDFLEGARARGFVLSVDMQAFTRKLDVRTGEVSLADAPEKRQIASLARKLKLDAVEAEILTGTADLEGAAVQVEEWGCPEIMVTSADGILLRYRGRTHFEGFSNRTLGGRTGRGDTAFGAYLARRLDHGVVDSLKIAAGVTSIKLETPGPFKGTIEEVLRRVEACHR